ncbi:hypothetical protein GH714_027814 [Hevea brasiliensis]|uniref:Carbonic anhydrase n=1 Tax=Hevea brasiliensis TaxID=3981 RepID=A0A6A6KVZ5_HEVBR|nr:hypothetical protein GH714_027814 [Hevea brasiliensis]
MANDSYEEAIAGLSKLLSEKADLGSVAAAKIKQITAELDAGSTAAFNPEERMKTGFIHFKTEKYDLWYLLAQILEFALLTSSISNQERPLWSATLPTWSLHMKGLLSNNPLTMYSGVGAAIEYAVLHLKVENIVVIGHSCCGGIKGLMSIPDDGTTASEFIENWVQICSIAKTKVKTDYSSLSFEEQCLNCEKEAVNVSLENLLTYPFVREGLLKKTLALKGAHYDFVKGTFELWNLDFKVTPAVAL